MKVKREEERKWGLPRPASVTWRDVDQATVQYRQTLTSEDAQSDSRKAFE